MNSNHTEIYLDASATSPPLNNVIDQISYVQKAIWGNPSSIHNIGLKSAELLERSRFSIAEKFNVLAEQIIFTSGATESINIAIRNISLLYKPSRIVISSVEHPAVIYAANSLKRNGWQVKYWPVDNYGTIDLTYIDEMLSEPTKILSIISAQSEIGTTQPIKKIAIECKKRGIYFHTDATQIISQGLIDFEQLKVSSLSASAHKFRGPKGVGFLILDKNYLAYLKDNKSDILHENGIRAGTQPVPLIHGMSVALNSIDIKTRIDLEKFDFADTYTTKLTNYLRLKLLELPGLSLIGHPYNRLPNHISLLITKNGHPISSHKLVLELSKNGIYASSGTACSSHLKRESNTLKAIGIPSKYSKSNLRLSLGNWLFDLDINYLCNRIYNTINIVAENQS